MTNASHAEPRTASHDVRTISASTQDRASEQGEVSYSDAMVLNACFSDETEQFRSPAEPEPGQTVTVRLRVGATFGVRPYLLVVGANERIPMRKSRQDDLFTWYEAELACPDAPISYRFVVEYGPHMIACQKNGACWIDASNAIDPQLDFNIFPGYHTPAWAQGAIMYQIFPDRFANGNQANDVRNGEYAYDNAPVKHVDDWDALPAQDDYRCFYGGDLQGVAAKLDYLQSLGVQAIYLNPIFISPSSHGYDIQNYEHVDPHLAVICDDVVHPLQEGDTRNAGALSYIRRTTSPENLQASDEYFAAFCNEVHRRGMRIILDGVFNHCGSFAPWLNREGVYHHDRGFALGALESKDSPYRHYFNFDDSFPYGYESWWGFPTLPKLNYEEAPDLVERIIEAACHWASPPYSIDGWRLDVAADVGHSPEFNHRFWHKFRMRVKEANPDLLILAEHYGDPSAWLRGGEWDTVMNYDAFMEPLTFFLTGMEKHSDDRREELYQNGEEFWNTMRTCMARFGWGSLACAMNQLSNHDHSRFLTRTNQRIGRVASAGQDAAGEHVDKRVLREAVVVQMTWPGAPTIYYGDEAGLVGWTDPDCRRTYPWGSEDWGLIELHRALADLRAAHPSLRSGSLVSLGGGYGWIAFGRFTDEDRVVVVCNNAEYGQDIDVQMRAMGARDGDEAIALLRTTKKGFRTEAVKLGRVESGSMRLEMPARSAFVIGV